MELSNYELVRYPSGQFVLLRSGVNAPGHADLGAASDVVAAFTSETEAQSALRAASPAPRPSRRPATARRTARLKSRGPLTAARNRSFLAQHDAAGESRMPRPRLRFGGDAMTCQRPAPAIRAIYLLGDHLDAALAMGEDLLTERVALAEAEQKLNMARLVRQNRRAGRFPRHRAHAGAEPDRAAAAGAQAGRGDEAQREPAEAADRAVRGRHGAAGGCRRGAGRHHEREFDTGDAAHGLPAQPRPDRARRGGAGADCRSSP